MSGVDYAVMLGTLLFIAGYGAWKTRKARNIEGYLRGDNQLKWATIGLSVMATQASAITFLSVPGQAFESGMAFVQNYLGMPLALIVVSAVFIPLYFKLKVYTAYEYLEKRFDLKSRLLAAFIFLIQRGLAAGITIYAPAIVLSSVLGWNLSATIILVGAVVIFYTVSGGTRAVSITQKWQMTVILIGMFTAFVLIVRSLPENVGMWQGIKLAGKMGKTDAINFNFDLSERYTFWSGLFGGFFLSLSYFGTDQSQVQRYIGGKGTRESRMGLMFNAALKIPMQFFILLTGVMVFVFYTYKQHDVLFDSTSLAKVEEAGFKAELDTLRLAHYSLHQNRKEVAEAMIGALESKDPAAIEQLRAPLMRSNDAVISVRDQAKSLVLNVLPEQKHPDSDYVFIHYILNYMPRGMIGLLIAVILAAAMSSTAGELNALGSTATIDLYKRVVNRHGDENTYVRASRWLTAGWGLVAIFFALYAGLFENLIEGVNILGSLFYGPILGIFATAFFLKRVQGDAVFIAALLAQASVLFIFYHYREEVAYLLLNPIGCGLVMLFSAILSTIPAFNKKPL